MDATDLEMAGATCWVSRSGYTGEDGFEISVPNTMATSFARALLENPGVAARSASARATRCGSRPGSASTATTSTRPPRRSRPGCPGRSRRCGAPVAPRAGGFPGADAHPRRTGRPAQRASASGLLPEGRAPMRAGTPLFASADAADPVGAITSGAFGPSIERPMSMGYVPGRARRPRHHGVRRSARQAPAAPPSPPFPSIPTATSADQQECPR